VPLIDTKHVTDEAITKVVVASDAITALSATDAVVVTAAVDVGATVGDQDILAIFSTEYDIAFTDPPPHQGSPRTVAIVTSLYDTADTFVDSQTTNIYEQFGQAAAVQGYGRYINSAQTLTTTTGVGDVVTFGAAVSVLGSNADSSISYSSGEFTLENTSLVYEITCHLTFERTAGSSNQTLVMRLQYWNGSAWVDCSGSISRGVSVGNTGGQWTTLVFHTWTNASGQKLRVVVLPSAASAFTVNDGTIMIKRTMLSPFNGGRVTGNITTALVIPTSEIAAGSNTVRMKAKLSSTSGIFTANFNDSKLVSFLRKK